MAKEKKVEVEAEVEAAPEEEVAVEAPDAEVVEEEAPEVEAAEVLSRRQKKQRAELSREA